MCLGDADLKRTEPTPLYAATVFLEVRTDNDAAIGLYRAHDFEVVGVRKRYYQPSGADAYTMRRPGRSTVEEGGAA